MSRITPTKMRLPDSGTSRVLPPPGAAPSMRGQRQLEAKGGAPSRHGQQFDFTLMQLQDAVHDQQPESAGAAFADVGEGAAEQVFQQGGRHARPRVADGDAQDRRARRDGDGQPGAGDPPLRQRRRERTAASRRPGNVRGQARREKHLPDGLRPSR